MNNGRILRTATALIFWAAIGLAQQDTLYFDPGSGNYIVQYNGETEEGNDTLVVTSIEPATKIDPKVNCYVVFYPSSRKFSYSYQLQNGARSEQNLVRFILEIGNVDIVDKSTKWTKIGGRMMETRNGKVSYANRWLWTANQGLEPTWSTDGFKIESAALPAIKNAYFQGRARIPSFAAGGPNEDLGKKIAALRIFPADCVLRVTTSPGDLPGGIETLTFLDTLISYKHQALVLKWIDNEGIANSLDQKLENARQKLQIGDSVAARNILNAFVNEVEAQKDKHLTSEAYALLKFNAEYLIDRLPQTGKKEK